MFPRSQANKAHSWFIDMRACVRSLLFPSLMSCLLTDTACQKASAPVRLPTPREVSEEKVIANYLPTFLHALPAENDAHYVLWTSERPELSAAFRPLATTEQLGPPGFAPRAEHVAFVGGRLVEAPVLPSPKALPGTAKPTPTLTLLSYDRDAKTAQPVSVPLPGPCTLTQRALLTSNGQALFVLARCNAEQAAQLLTLDASLSVVSVKTIEGAAQAELFLHHGDSDYLVSARQVMRIPPQGLPVIGTVQPPLGNAETRDCVVTGKHLWVIDGGAGRVTGMDSLSMGWVIEKRFHTEGTVTRLRAAATSSRLHIVWSEQLTTGQQRLLGAGFSLETKTPESTPPDRLHLGQVDQRNDHDLLPLASGSETLLFRTHKSNTGPSVVMQPLSL